MNKYLSYFGLWLLASLMLFATVVSALDESLNETEVNTLISSLPPAGMTPSNPLWAFDVAGERVKIAYLKVAKTDSDVNEYRLEKIEERLSELGFVAGNPKSEDKIDENIKENQLGLYVSGSSEQIKRSILVLNAVSLKLKEKGIDNSGVENAISRQEKIKSYIEKKNNVEISNDGSLAVLVEGGEFN